uniref:AAA domain-containing protein n=1 Tax=Clostridium sp. NkU-1 TaxID=1095009 RepID=UPI003261689E
MFTLRKKEGTRYRGKPDDLYFPFEPLIKWFETKPETKFVRYNEYLELVGKDKEDELVIFLTDLGVKDVPRILSRQLSNQEAMEIQNSWPYSSRSQTWTEKEIDGCAEVINSIVEKHDFDLSVLLWCQLLKFIEIGYIKDNCYWSQNNVLLGRYEYFYYSAQSETFESKEAKSLRTQPWLINADGKFVSSKNLSVQTLNEKYDISSDEVIELFRILGIKEEFRESIEEDVNITSLGEQLGLSEEEQRLALFEFANKKKIQESYGEFESNDDAEDDSNSNGFTNVDEENINIRRPSIKRVGKEITKRATCTPKNNLSNIDYIADDASADEDDYSKPTVDISKRIEKVKKLAEREIQEIALLEDLKQQAQEADVYSYGWFKALLELEALNNGENNANSREISISFAKVEREIGTSRTLILKHPNRYIPQSMEDLADIPLELHFISQPTVKVAIEVVSVKSYTLRVKLRTNVQIDGIDLSQVTEARIEAHNPVFLIEELRKSFIKLGEENGYEDHFNMKQNLCENIEFVFGPPGTGKTTHVARDILLPMMHSEQDLKVLVLTPTNKSADVLVRRLMETMGSDQNYMNWLIRFGATNDNAIEQSGVFRDKTFDIRTFTRNVTVTTIARFPYDYFLPEEGTRLHLSALKWDYIIIDEASMIPLANIIYPIYKKTPKKFFYCGGPVPNRANYDC